MRTGVIAKKLGMTQIYSEDGQHLPATVLQVENCQVVSLKTKDKHGYNAVQLGAGAIRTKNVTKPQRGMFGAMKVEPKRKMVEFRVSDNAMVEQGAEIVASHFIAGQYVDVTGNGIGKGFAGPMKRWNFRGLEASHGVSVSHRSHGSTGQRQDPGKVFKGKKMAGHLGTKRVTVQNLQVISTDDERGLIIVRGAVPGAENGYILVKDAVKKALPPKAPFPAGIRQQAKKETVTETAPEVSANDAAATEAPETTNNETNKA